MELCTQLYLKDAEINLERQIILSENQDEDSKVSEDWLIDLGQRASSLKNLTLVDCNITGLSCVLDVLG